MQGSAGDGSSAQSGPAKSQSPAGPNRPSVCVVTELLAPALSEIPRDDGNCFDEREGVSRASRKKGVALFVKGGRLREGHVRSPGEKGQRKRWMSRDAGRAVEHSHYRPRQGAFQGPIVSTAVRIHHQSDALPRLLASLRSFSDQSASCLAIVRVAGTLATTAAGFGVRGPPRAAKGRSRPCVASRSGGDAGLSDRAESF